jgi:DNA-binding CsgD family transcriptional regulator
MSKGTNIGEDFSPEQLECIELLSNGGLSHEEIAKQLSISTSTITRWKRNSCFMNAVISRTRELLKGALPDIYQVAVKQAKAGNHQHIKILLDHLDNLEKYKAEKSSASITFTWDISDSPDTIQTPPVPETTP